MTAMPAASKESVFHLFEDKDRNTRRKERRGKKDLYKRGRRIRDVVLTPGCVIS